MSDHADGQAECRWANVSHIRKHAACLWRFLCPTALWHRMGPNISFHVTFQDWRTLPLVWYRLAVVRSYPFNLNL